MNRVDRQIEAIIMSPDGLMAFLKELPANRRATALQPLQDALLGPSSTRDALQVDLEIMARTDLGVADMIRGFKSQAAA